MKAVIFVKRAVPLLLTSAVLLAAPLHQAEAQEKPSPAPREPVERPKLPPVPSGPKLPSVPSDPTLPRIHVNPPTIVSPQANASVASPLTVSGTGMGGMAARVRVTIKGDWEEAGKKVSRDVSNSSAVVNAQGAWETAPMPLNVPADAKNVKFQISAVQSLGGHASPPTTITVTPALQVAPMPPPTMVGVFQPFLTVTSPKNDHKLSGKPKSLTMSGTASGEKVDVYMEIKIHRETGGFFSSKQKTVQQLHRNNRGVAVKDGKWSTNLDLSLNNEKDVTKVVYTIHVSMTDKGKSLQESIVVTR